MSFPSFKKLLRQPATIRDRKRTRARRRSLVESLEARNLLATVNVAVEPPGRVAENNFPALVYTLTRDQDLSEPLTVKFELSGTATYDVDYDLDPGPLSIAPGVGTVTFEATESTAEISVDPANDLDLEGHESVIVTIVDGDEFGDINGADFDDSGADPILYAVDMENRLATIDAETGCVKVIGTMTLSLPTEIMTDIAITPGGTMYGISFTNTYLIDPTNASVTLLGAHGMPDGNALASDSTGQVFGAAEDSTSVFTINTTTGVATFFRDLGFQSSGDLAFVDSKLYMTTPGGGTGDDLIEVATPIATGAITNQTSLGETEVFALAYEPGTFIALSRHKALTINKTSFNVNDRFEMTGRAYTVGPMNSATGFIDDDEVIHTFTVNSTGDGSDTNPGDGVARDASGDTTLRAAIEEANALANEVGDRDRIHFNIPGAGVHLIQVGSPLPAITESVIIDATTEPGYIGTPRIQLDGNNAVNRGIYVTAGDSDVKGLSVTGFTASGIEVANGGGNLIEENYVGMSPAAAADPNFFGIRVQVSPSNTISDNVIGGNQRAGVFITGVASSGNQVSQNNIGTNPQGTAAIPNGTDGLTVFAPNNTISDNLISGNARWGVVTKFAHATGNSIDDNTIGLNDAGTLALPNAIGVTLQSGPNTVTDNTISGNTAYGVALAFATATGNTVKSNNVGVNAAGTAAIGNGIVGVRITNGSNNVVGGPNPGDRNVISGNGQFGVLVGLVGADDNQIINNRIGTNAAGTAALPNTTDGVRVVQGAKDTQITDNLISGNGGRAISTDGATTTGTDIMDNLIGTNVLGTAKLLNGAGGAIRLLAPSSHVSGNTISSVDTGILAFRDATDLQITNNLIGTNATGFANLGMPEGIRLTSGASDATISQNVITNNVKGVVLNGSATRDRITQNSIFGNSSIGIDLGNDGSTANDAGDADTGNNQLQNTPVLTAATLGGGNLTITFSVDSTTVNSNYDLTIEFFLADAAGQGKTFLGSATYPAADAQSSVMATIPVFGIAAGNTIVATATDSLGNTSEFSLGQLVA